MSEERYDALVIGAGMGGLTAAATLVQAGLKVAVFEARHHPGGYCTSFKRPGPFTFNAAVSSLSALNKAGWLGSILDRLGIYQPQNYIKLETLKDLVFPRHRLRVRGGAKDLEEQLIGLFPGEQEGIKEIFQIFAQIYRELQDLTAAQLAGNLRGVTFPSYSRYKNWTLGKLLDSQLREPQLKSIFAGQCFYMGSPPSRASLVAVASMFMAYLEDGTYHVVGGVQALPDLLARYIQEGGGKIFLRTPVKAILCEAQTAKGVLIGEGESIFAPLVISNIDPFQTLALLPPGPVLEDYRRRLSQLSLSPSYFKIYLGVDLPLQDLDLAPHLDYFPSYDIEALFAEPLKGNYSPQLLSYDISIPSLADKTLAPPGRHSLSVTLLAAYNTRQWKEYKEELKEKVLASLERHLPEISRHILWKEAATPWTMERFTGNYRGAAYGWEQTPEQMGGRRVSPLTPIRGLYLAGHWTNPGGGVASVAVSGMLTAKEALKKI